MLKLMLKRVLLVCLDSASEVCQFDPPLESRLSVKACIFLRPYTAQNMVSTERLIQTWMSSGRDEEIETLASGNSANNCAFW